MRRVPKKEQGRRVAMGEGCELNGITIQNNLQDPSVRGDILPTAEKDGQMTSEGP